MVVKGNWSEGPLQRQSSSEPGLAWHGDRNRYTKRESKEP